MSFKASKSATPRGRTADAVAHYLRASLAFCLALLVATATGQTPASVPADREFIPLTAISAAQVARSADQPLAIDAVPTARPVLDEARRHLEEQEPSAAAFKLETALREAQAALVPELHLEFARARLALNRTGDALASIDAALALQPDAISAWRMRADVLRRTGGTDDAIASLRAATVAAERNLNDPDGSLAWFELGDALESAGYFAAALEAFAHFDDAVWEHQPEHRNAPAIAALLEKHRYGALERRSALLRRLGRAADVAHITAAFCERIPGDARLSMMHYRALREAGRDAEALTHCDRQLAAEPMPLQLISAAVSAAQAAGTLEPWVESRSASWQPAALAALFSALTDKNPDLAVRVAERIPASSRSADQVVALARLRVAAGGAAAALGDLKSWLEARPDLSLTPVELLRGWRAALAGADFDDLLAEPAAEPLAEFVACLTLAAIGKEESAEPRLMQLQTRAPDLALARTLPVQWLLERGEWVAARDAAGLLAAEPPMQAAAALLRAIALDGLDDNAAAEKEFRAALRANPRSLDAHLALARHHRRLENWLGAQRYFQEALTLAPQSTEALQGLIEAYLRGGKLDLARAQQQRAEGAGFPSDTLDRVRAVLEFAGSPAPGDVAVLRAAFDADSSSVWLGSLLLDTLLSRRMPADAERIARQLLTLHPADAELTASLAASLVQQANFADGIALYRVLRTRYPNRLRVGWPLAQALLYDFQIEEARALLRELATLAGEARAAMDDLLLRSYVELGEVEPALALVAEREKADPDAGDWRRVRFSVLRAGDRAAEAFQTVRAELDQRPADPELREEFVTLGMAARAFGDVAARVEAWRAEDPSSSFLVDLQLSALAADKRYADALALLDRFERENEKSTETRLWRARVLAAAGRIDEALAEFQTVETELTPMGPAAIWTLRPMVVAALIEARKADAAVERTTHWLAETGRDSPFHASALRLHSASIHAAGRETDYLAVMQQLAQLEPSDVGIMNDLGYSLLETGGDRVAATEMIRRAVAAEPWNAAYLDSLGWAYYKAGDFPAAAEQLSRAARLRAGRDGTILDHWGDARYRIGDADGAREAWQRARAALLEAAADAPPEDEELLRRVEAKLKQLESGGEPAVAPASGGK